MTTPIQTLYNYVNSSGLLAPWIGPEGSTEPAPAVQMRTLEEADAPSNERILLIRNVSSGSGSRFLSDPVFVFAIMGKVGESEVYAETYAEPLYAELLKFDHDDCVISIKPLGRIGGPYKTDSGRQVYDMEFTVSVDSGIMV